MVRIKEHNRKSKKTSRTYTSRFKPWWMYCVVRGFGRNEEGRKAALAFEKVAKKVVGKKDWDVKLRILALTRCVENSHKHLRVYFRSVDGVEYYVRNVAGLRDN